MCNRLFPSERALGTQRFPNPDTEAPDPIEDDAGQRAGASGATILQITRTHSQLLVTCNCMQPDAALGTPNPLTTCDKDERGQREWTIGG